MNALHINRRQAVVGGTGLALGSALTLLSHAQEPGRSAVSDKTMIDAETQTLIDRGLKSLADSQARDGSFADVQTRFGNVAITALAGLALMAAGHQPGRGRYGDNVARAADYVMKRGIGTSPPGYLSNVNQQINNAAMYQHAFGALFLSEVHGMMPDAAGRKRLRETLEQAIALTRNSQNREGGWRYEPRPTLQADVSVTVAQLMALRAARNAGIYVPKSVADKAVEYIQACQRPDGGFCYIKGQGYVGSAFPRSAAAVVGLFSAGIYSGKVIDRGLDYLMRFMPGRGQALGLNVGSEYYFYGHYYAALAMWTAGGTYWDIWFPAIRNELASRAQRVNNGLWSDWNGAAYATAMACIILQLSNNYLPIMQK